MSLPLPLAVSMERALAEERFPIRAGRYERGVAMCPLGAADAYAESHGGDRFDGWNEARYAARVIRFAVSFDLSAEVSGVERALALVREVLKSRLASR